jgi:hypothetical protein
MSQLEIPKCAGCGKPIDLDSAEVLLSSKGDHYCSKDCVHREPK